MFDGGDAGVSVLSVTVSADTIFAGAGIDKVFGVETVEVVVLRGVLVSGGLPVSVCGRIKKRKGVTEDKLLYLMVCGWGGEEVHYNCIF